MLTLQISKAEIAELKYEMYHYPDALVQKRFHSIYLKAIAPELSCQQIGLYVSLSRQKVSAFIKLYNQSGIQSLKFNNYGTNKSELENYSETLLLNLENSPVHQLSQAKERIEFLTGITRSLSAVESFLKRNDFTYQKTGHIPSKADVQKQETYLEETLNPAIEKAKNGEIHLLFLDAAHFVMGVFLCNMWSKVRLFIKSSAGRQRLNVIGTIDAITKKVLFQTNITTVNAQVMASFLYYLKSQLPDKPIAIVLDNARYQHCNYIKEVATELGIILLFLPPYSPNLNLIERLWKFTKKTVLSGRYYEKFDKFQVAITDCLNQVNDKYSNELQTLMTLNFQTFKNVNIYPV
jgi:transposase